MLYTNGGYDNYIIFNNSNSNIERYNSETSPLEETAKSYNIIYPSSGAFVWDENLKFMGVKALGTLNDNENEPENALIRLTNDYPKTFAFLIERNHNSIMIYHHGRLQYEYYLSDYDGGWRIRSKDEMLSRIKSSLRISRMNDSKAKVYERVFDIVWWLSYKKIGSMIVIAHPEKIDLLKSHSEQGMVINMPLKTLKKSNMIYDLAMVDGAILMDEDDMVYYGGLHFSYDEKNAPLEPDMKKKLEKNEQGIHKPGILFVQKMKKMLWFLLFLKTEVLAYSIRKK